MNRTTQALYIYLASWSLFILLGCGNPFTEQRLASAGSLLVADNLNEAESTLRQTNGMDMTEKEHAKYSLLSILAAWGLFHPIKNETDLNNSISYHEQENENTLLAHCCYMQGALLSDKGKNEEAVMQSVHVEDSSLKAGNRKDLETVRKNFEQQLREEKQQHVSAYTITAIPALILGIGILIIIYLWFRVQKMKSLLYDDRLEISILNKQIAETEQALANADTLCREQESQINKLKQEIARIEERHNGLLADGRQCYDSILKGKNIVTWDKRRFLAFIEFYKIIDTGYLYELEKEYHDITNKNKLILILLHLGLSQVTIAEKLGVGEGAVRTALSRLKKKRNKM